MDEIDKLKVLLAHWIEHNRQHTNRYKEWILKAGDAEKSLNDAVMYSDKVNDSLSTALFKLGG